MKPRAITDRRAVGRAIVTMALLLSFFAQVLSPLQHLVAARAQAGGLQGDWIVLCTAQGMKVIRLADLGSQDLPDTKPQAPLCPICVGHVALGEPAPDVGDVVRSSRVVYSPLLASATPAPARAHFVLPHGARAPPV